MRSNSSLQSFCSVLRELGDRPVSFWETHSPQGRRTHVGERPVLRVVEGRESGREETPDVVERRRRVEVRAAQHDEVEV